MSITINSVFFIIQTSYASGKQLDCAYDVRVRRIGSDAENSGTLSMDNGDYQAVRHGDILIEAGTLYVAPHS